MISYHDPCRKGESIYHQKIPLNQQGRSKKHIATLVQTLSSSDNVKVGAEIFFHPEIYNDSFTTPLPAIVDKCIQLSPIDTRRALYKACHSKAEYQEYGASICRTNPVFKGMY
ncbi:hypothetical protein GW17_00013492 [Ensete ventricosum]|uniref:Uncharacterized protein n=1 Tax=Ensete ventricosum TaxID=4639 RepID=A0A444FI66_ENSVE|nr:hypothetical protein B296_00010712 [Ensete ventricosum]RWW22312.1 hypothetical protein GW17_00013492 [Ensete ventricosum]RZR82739.1 hypothetical protein BHM03_00009234 [Ensete ventricosum]